MTFKAIAKSSFSLLSMTTPKPQTIERAATAPAVQSLIKPAAQPAANANNTTPAEKK